MAMDRKDKKDLNARMTDVEEVSCKNCYGLKRNQTGDCRHLEIPQMYLFVTYRNINIDSNFAK